MGISKEQLLNALGISKGYNDAKLSESERRINVLVQTLYDVIANGGDNEINVVDKASGLQDTPVGHVMAYMGNAAPAHYLICDGRELNIMDYPILSQHFLAEFGRVNHFGGDGETTFAVPDLRGEFLRGTGTASRKRGSGAAVGVHQDPTYYPNTFSDANNITVRGKSINFDHEVTNNGGVYKYTGATTISNRTTQGYAPRVTNTAVLYCIKYEPTYYLKTEPSAGWYSNDEICTGRWTSGQPLYRRVFHFTSSTRTYEIPVPELDGITVTDIRAAIEATSSSGRWTVCNNQNNSTSVDMCIWYSNDDNKVKVSCGDSAYLPFSASVVLEYIKPGGTVL